MSTKPKVSRGAIRVSAVVPKLEFAAIDRVAAERKQSRQQAATAVLLSQLIRHCKQILVN